MTRCARSGVSGRQAMSDFVEDLFLVDVDTQYVSFHVSKQTMTSTEAFTYIGGIQNSYPRSGWQLVDSKTLQFYRDLNLDVSHVWEDVNLIAQRCLSSDGFNYYWITTNTSRYDFLDYNKAHVVLIKRK